MTTSSPPQRSITLLLLFLLSLGAAAQDTEPNGAPKILRDKVEPHWFAGTNKFWYRVRVAADRHEFVLVDAVQGIRAPAFDHERLAKALNQQTGKTLKPDQLPFDALKFSDDGNSVELIANDEAWQCDLGTYQLTEAKPAKPEKAKDSPPSAPERRRHRSRREDPPAKSPDGKWEAVVRGHNLFLPHLHTEQQRPLTLDANPDNSYARDSQRDRATALECDLREPETPGRADDWPPDSRRP